MKNSTIICTICLLALSAGRLSAQQPGGVGSPDLWFQTRAAGMDDSLRCVYRWQDFSGDSLHLNNYDTLGAGYGSEYRTHLVRFFNGHAALNLEKIPDIRSREVQLKRSDLSQATIIGAFAPVLGLDDNQFLYGLHGSDGQGAFVGSDKVYRGLESGRPVFDYGETEGMDLRYSPNDAESNIDDFREASFRIATYYRSVPPRPASSLWGEKASAVLTFKSGYLPGNVNHNSAYLIPILENRPFLGYVPEIVVYNRLLAPLERREVETYMAIKYGISLPVSYIGSDGQLMWDNAAAGDYPHRIAAIYRDDKSHLNQIESSTSYSEKSAYSATLFGDYYHLADPNHRTSGTRLLTIGREDGNELTSDGDFLFWSDNDASITLNSTPWNEGLKRMNRQWLIKTNITPNPQLLSWNVENLEFKTNNGNLISIRKPGGFGAQTGTALTAQPLLSKSGYIGISEHIITGGLTLRFGAQNASYTAGAHDYGYFIDTDQRIYKIISGVKEATHFDVLLPAVYLEVEKTESDLFLRINGHRIAQSQIAIAAGDRDKSFYGAIAVERGITDAGFKLRHGGFTDTGNRVELSYACIGDFFGLGEEKAILVIDRSGTGQFNLSDVTYIPVSEVDLIRSKLIFHNVFFDTDNSGSDVMTFAYGNPDALGCLEVVQPSCGQSDGQIHLNVYWGIRGFNYTLKNTATGVNVRSGWEGTRNINLAGLPAGAYELTVTEAGGFTFETSGASSGALLRAKTTNLLPAIDGHIPFRVSDLNATYTIGYTASTATVSSSSNVFHYGLKQVGNKLYKVENGRTTQISGVTLQIGDELKIVKGLVSISYHRNGSQIGTSLIRLQDYGLSFRGLIDFGSGPTELLNVKAEGFFNLLDYSWDTTNGVIAMRSTSVQKTFPINMADCGLRSSVAASSDLSEEPMSGGYGLQVSSIPGSLILQARIALEAPTGVSLLVYDMQGRLAARKELTMSQGVSTEEIPLPQTGIYIVKALTSDGREYGQKIIIR